jgi:hypothetical protein
MAYEIENINLPDLQDDSKEGVVQHLRVLNQAISERDELIKQRIGRAGIFADVRDFGAIGDGVHDDTTAIQNALDSGKGIVYLPPGTYKTTSDLTIPNGVTFQGSGFEIYTSRLRPTSSVSIVIKNSNWDAGGDNSQITIRDLAIDADYGDVGTAIALKGYWYNLSNIKFRHTNSTSGGIRLKDGQYATIHNIIGLGHSAPGTAGTGYGIVLDNFDSVFGTFDVEGFTYGLYLKNASKGNNLTGRFELCATHGVLLDGCDDNNLSCVFNNCGTRWVYLTGTSLNNRIFISRGSDTNVPAVPILINTNASGNFVFTDEAYILNNSDNTIFPDKVTVDKLNLKNYFDGTEISDPSAPSSNKGRLYFRDNGSGKTQLVVRFNSGAVQVIATEP